MLTRFLSSSGWVGDGRKYLLSHPPGRFGKSQLLDMLRSLFKGHEARVRVSRPQCRSLPSKASIHSQWTSAINSARKLPPPVFRRP